MAIPQNDNLTPLFPKPLVENERKLVDGQYVDYDSIDEVKSLTNASLRLHKYFWISSNLYQVDEADNFRLVGGKSTEFLTTEEFFDDQNLTS